MRHRKLLGGILIAVTFVYLFASLLAAYQNQRVTLEKGIAEAVKGYAEREELERKELNKDFSLLLDDKMSVEEGKQQVLKFEGSFARVEKGIQDVSGGVEQLQTSISYVNEKLEQAEKKYETEYETVKKELEEIQIQLVEMEEIKMKLAEVEKIKTKLAQMEEMKEKLAQMEELKERVDALDGDILYYQYDSQSNTLNVYGK